MSSKAAQHLQIFGIKRGWYPVAQQLGKAHVMAQHS